MSPRPEAAFQSDVCAFARRLGWSVYSVGDSRRGRVSANGWPDLSLSHPRHGLWFAELKAGRGKATPEQLATLDRLVTAGVSGVRGEVWHPDLWPRIEQVLLGGLSDA